MHPYHHAITAARKFHGVPEDYLDIENWFDQSKSHFADFRHRAARHHSEGIFMAEQIFGVTIKNSNGDNVPVRMIGEQHVKEDLGWIPTLADWLKEIRPKPWMMRNGMKGNEQSRSQPESH